VLSGQTELPYEVLCQRRSYEYREHPLSIEFDLAPSVVGSMIGRVGGVVMFRFVSLSLTFFPSQTFLMKSEWMKGPKVTQRLEV
jgi:hypothetical protein